MKRKNLLQILIWAVLILMIAVICILVVMAARNSADADASGFLRRFFYDNAIRVVALLLLSDALVILLLRRSKLLGAEALERERTHQTLEDLISKKISEQYFNIYCVDMDKDRVIYTASSEIAARHYGKSILSGQEPYSRIASLYCQNYVAPEERERVQAACALDNVRSQLSEHGAFSLMFLGEIRGAERYVGMRFIRLPYQEGKNLFIWAFTDAEGRMRAELQKYEQNAVISGLAQDFDCVSYADLRGNTIKDHRVSAVLSDAIDGWNETVNYTAKMMLFVNTLVVPSEQENLMQRLSPESVLEALAKDDVFYVITRVSLQGKERMYQIKFAADTAKPGHAIIGFHNINAAAAERRKDLIQNAVMNGLTSDFACIVYVELAENHVTPCRISELFAKYIPGWRKVTDYAVRARLLADALVVDEDRERFLQQTSPEQVMKELSEAPVYYVTFRVRCEDTECFYQAKYIMDPENKSCVILGVHNVDREKKQEMERTAEQDSARIRSGFLTQMGRDILSPLQSIHNVLEGARENIADAERLSSSMDKAIVTSEYLHGLVSDVLNMTHGGGDRIQIVREPVNLRVFAERCFGAIEEQAREKNIILVRYFDDIAHPHVLFDAAHLRQILLNLLNNAVKFTPEGGSIAFRVSELTANDRSVTYKIDISNSGAGMDREILERIWDVLNSRVDTSEPKNTATGLGLSVCKMLADMMGATITVDSKAGEGSCFSVLLTMELDRDACQAAAGEDTSILKGMRILVAEDNELSLSILSELLGDAGAVLTSAENGRRALEAFRDSAVGTYDLILMDGIMPEMDGAAATQAIRALQRPDAETVTIIGMSTGYSEEDMTAFRTAGVSAYIEKPVQIPVLINTLLTCIHNRSQLLEKELAVANESSTKDALTGVRNRTAYERAGALLDRAIAAGSAAPFAFLFCDVNGLKKTNDTYGHERGDELIRSACRQICDVFAHSDVFRVGGDEFAVILRGSDYEEREALLRRLTPAEDYNNVSIACGMAVFEPGSDPDLLSVCKRADAKMYENKRIMKLSAEA